MTTPAAIPLAADDEIVVSAWLASIPGFTAAMTGPVLPPDVDENGKASPWVSTGFVTMTTVGGSPDPLLPVNEPVMQLQCWATVLGSNRPPWQLVKALGQAITVATWNHEARGRHVTPVVNGVEYPAACVQGARMLTSWRRAYSDIADYASISADLWLSWIQPGLTV